MPNMLLQLYLLLKPPIIGIFSRDRHPSQVICPRLAETMNDPMFV